jgi:RNA-binding protein 5/10
MFFHASTEFFYDPKSKLYFGNKEQLYYQHCPGQDPPYQVIEQTEEHHDTPTTSVKTVAQEPERKKIAICLKTKALPGAAADEKKKSKKQDKNKDPAPKPSATSTAPVVPKEHATKMDLWSERGKELRGEAPLVRTKTGQPVCLLCHRKFPDVSKLRRHEDLSELHKENLVKKQQQQRAAAEASTSYRDRALERRILHGDDTDAGTLVGRPLQEQMSKEIVGPKENLNLGASNIGNQMLQKLGWKAGSAIGRHSDKPDEGVLQKEWERIEAMAAKSQSR